MTAWAAIALVWMAAEPSIERLIDQGRLAEARQGLERLRAESGESPRVALLDAMILFRDGRAAEALGAVKPSADNGTASADGYKLTALCLAALGRSRETEPYLRAAVRLKPSDAMAHYYLGLHLLGEHRYGEAAAALEQSILRNANYPDAHTMLGAAIEEAGRDDEALAHYRNGVEIASRVGLPRESPYVYLVRFLSARGRNAEAMAVAGAALKSLPKSAEMWRLAGQIHAAGQQFERAAEALSEAARLRPADRATRYQLMRVYLKLGRHEDAMREKEWLERDQRK
jgi:predicted Zn-dependent protease